MEGNLLVSQARQGRFTRGSDPCTASWWRTGSSWGWRRPRLGFFARETAWWYYRSLRELLALGDLIWELGEEQKLSGAEVMKVWWSHTVKGLSALLRNLSRPEAGNLLVQSGWELSKTQTEGGRQVVCTHCSSCLLPFALEPTLLRHESCSYQDHTWPPCCYALWTRSALILGGPRASSDIVDRSEALSTLEYEPYLFITKSPFKRFPSKKEVICSWN